MTQRWGSWGTKLVVAGALAVAASGFLPWGASGRRERTSFELLGVVERLEVLDGAASAVAQAWYLAPLAAAGVWLAAALGRRGLAVGLAVGLAALGTGLAIAVRTSPLLGRPGPYATIAAGAVVAIGAVVCLLERGRTAER